MRKNSDPPLFVETAVTVRYAETDQMGIVYYANYLVWFEVGRTAWCRARGFTYGDLEARHGRMLVVAEATCRYKAPARYEDEILIRTAASSATDKVICFVYEILNRNSRQLLATGESTHVVTNRECRPARLPAEILRLFRSRKKAAGTAP
jgi:acyl-CoA thioester hydrolase